jgi:filamentous hemagglutinin
VKIALFAVLAIVLAWLWLSSPGGGVVDRQKTPTVVTGDATGSKSTRQRAETTGGGRTAQPPASQRNPDNSRRDDDDRGGALIVHNARVTDEDKRVIYRGDVDLTDTVGRIERGKRLRFSHDGSEFENRERRLPKKPSGYYREYIHPTPGDDGPGGQRVIVGRDGEVFYTPDHYRTFERVR